MERAQFPTHVAVIPDGNRRWARERGRLGFEGHIEGAKRFREISKVAFKMGVHYFTFWAASEDNLRNRDIAEVTQLVLLFRRELERKQTLDNCLKNGIRFKTLGGWHRIVDDQCLLNAILALQERTKEFDQRFLTVLFGYSGEREMIETVKRVCKLSLGNIERLDGEVLKNALWTRELPPVDLIIRTGACEEGPNWSHNSSGFMMLLAANAKTFSPPTLWPDFTVEMFRQVVADYSKVPRRFGA
jgi:undecaprenyl diphosphate synthase